MQDLNNRALGRNSRNFLVPLTPHRIFVIFITLAFIVSKGFIANSNLQWISPAVDCMFAMAALILGWISLYETVDLSRWRWWFQTDYSGKAGWTIAFSAITLSSGALLSSVYHVLTTWRDPTNIGQTFVTMALTFGLSLVVALPCIMSVLHLREQGKPQNEDNHAKVLENDGQLRGESEKS